jgi:hypothetical protein
LGGIRGRRRRRKNKKKIDRGKKIKGEKTKKISMQNLSDMPGHADYICNYTADPTGEYEPFRSTGELHADLQLGTELCVSRRNFKIHLLL